MKKELIKLGLVAGIATTSLFGFTYEIKQGWQQLGAIKDFDDLKPFDDASCVEYLWHYDLDEPEDKDKWKLHISDGKNYNYCGETFSSLKKGDGFWLKASGECNVTVTEPNNCNTSGFPTPPSLDGSTCDVNNSNPTIGTTPTGLAATTTVISSNMNHLGGVAVDPVIMPDKNTVNTQSYAHGYFYDENSTAVIKVDESFRFFTNISNLYPTHKGQLKITNINTNQSVLTIPYPDPVNKDIYYQMTDTLPAGTYRFEKASTSLNNEHLRIDDGWFFEKYE